MKNAAKIFLIHILTISFLPGQSGEDLKNVARSVGKASVKALGEAFFSGKEGEKDEKQEEESITGTREYKLGNKYYYGTGDGTTDIDQAIYWYKHSAEKGYPPALYMLGFIYEKDFENLKEARYWYERAAGLGHVLAQYNLATFYKHGIGTPKNLSEAVFWLERVANNTEDKALATKAQYQLGTLYYYGKEIEKDKEKAKYWLQKAADNGHEKAKELLTKIK